MILITILLFHIPRLEWLMKRRRINIKMIWKSAVRHRMVVKCVYIVLKFSKTMNFVVAVCHFEYFLCAVFFISFSFYCLRAPNVFASAHIFLVGWMVGCSFILDARCLSPWNNKRWQSTSYWMCNSRSSTTRVQLLHTVLQYGSGCERRKEKYDRPSNSIASEKKITFILSERTNTQIRGRTWARERTLLNEASDT